MDVDVPGSGAEAPVSLTRRAANGAGWSAAGSAVTTIVQLAQLAIVAHLVSPREFGQLALVMVVLAYGSAFADAGLSQAIIFRQNSSADELGSIYSFNLLVGLALFVATCAIAPLVAGIYHEPALRSLIPLAAVGFLLIPFGQVFQSVLQQHLRFRALSIVDITTAIIGAIVTIVTALRGMGVRALILGSLASTLARALMLHVIGRRMVRIPFRLRVAELRPYASFGGFQLGERLLNLTSTNLDKIIIGGVLGTAALGIYNVAYQVMSRPLQVINPVLTRVAFPVFAMTQNDDERLRRGYTRLIGIASTIGFPVYFGAIAVAVPLFAAMFGSQWGSAVPVFRWLCVMGLLWTLSNPIGTLLLAKGRADWGMYFNIAAVASYSAAILFGARHGVIGVVVSMIVVSLAILVPLEFWARWRLIGLRPLPFIAAFARPLAMSLVMTVVVVLAMRATTSWPAMVQLIAGAIIGAVVYGLASLLWNRDELKLLWAAAPVRTL